MRKVRKIFAVICIFALLLNIMPQAFANANAYTVEDVYFSDLSGNVTENPSTSCVVNVKVKKQAERVGCDLVVITVYSTDGTMLGFTTVSADIKKGETGAFSTLVVSPSGKNIGLVKSYVWNNISEMRALSDVKQVIVNEMDEGIVLPPLGEDPVREKYIPDTVTVRATVSESYRSNSSLNCGEYNLSNPRMEPSFDNIYTEAEYDAYTYRLRVISDYYDVMSGLEGVSLQSTRTVFSDIDLSDRLFCEGRFTLKKNDNGKYEVVNFETIAAGDNIKELDAADYVPQESLAAVDKYSQSGKIRFGNKYYGMNMMGGVAQAELYVNGAYAFSNPDDLTLDKFLGNAVGKIRLVKQDGEYGYSKISVNYYDTASVVSAYHKNGQSTVLLTPSEDSYMPCQKITINDSAAEDGEVFVKVRKNGEEIALGDLKEGDIIAYATDIGYYARNITDPIFIDIIASDSKVSGILSVIDKEDEKCLIDGVAYPCRSEIFENISPGSRYTFLLDPFGKIYSVVQ